MSATLGDTARHHRRASQALTGREVAVVRGARAAGAARLRVPRDAAARDDRRAGRRRDARRSTWSTSPSGRAAEQAQNLMSVDFSSKEEKEAIRAALDGRALRHALRQGVPALPAPRHRHPPRGPAAEVPAAGRAAGAAGAAQGHQRHRHAGRRREHPDPHRAVHAAVQVRRREDRHPQRARLPADRRARGPQGLRRRGQRGRAGARARRSRTCGSRRRQARGQEGA